MWKEIRDREFGMLRPNSIQLWNYKEILSSRHASINSLLQRGRGSDATVAVYDIHRATDYEGGGLIAKHKSILLINKHNWYPIDTGLFITGSYDHHINVWDTNKHLTDRSGFQNARKGFVWTSRNLHCQAGQTSSAKVRAPHKKLNGNASKHHASVRISGQVKSVKQRLHPGMISSLDRATGHYGIITGLKGTDDGMYLLSAVFKS